MPEETERGERVEGFKGVSKDSLEDAIRRAVEESNFPDGSMVTVSHIAVRTEGDPNVGTYHVTVIPGG